MSQQLRLVMELRARGSNPCDMGAYTLDAKTKAPAQSTGSDVRNGMGV